MNDGAISSDGREMRPHFDELLAALDVAQEKNDPSRSANLSAHADHFPLR